MTAAGAAPGTLLKLAFDWAAVWHRDQKRKYPGVVVPYVSHIAGVSVVLSRHGFAEAVVAAGALHDVIEDCGVTREEIAARFGADVATLVAMSSEPDRSLPWEERKSAYLRRFSTHPWEAQAISLADKIDNLTSIAVCHAYFGDPWPQFKRGRDVQLVRFRELLERAREAKRHPLVDEYAEVLARVEALDLASPAGP